MLFRVESVRKKKNRAIGMFLAMQRSTIDRPDCRFPRPCGAIEPEHPLNPRNGEDYPVHYSFNTASRVLRWHFGASTWSCASNADVATCACRCLNPSTWYRLILRHIIRTKTRHPLHSKHGLSEPGYPEWTFASQICSSGLTYITVRWGCDEPARRRSTEEC